jgi:predicted nucleotidyltransferase
MRLLPEQQQAIKKYFLKFFEKGQVYLFGSRADDSKKGGDIDLYMVVPNLENLMQKKIDFLVAVKREIGNQKIDVVFDRGNNRLIDRIAKKEGILL